MKPLLRHSANDQAIAQPRVLQFGGGNFLKAFLDWMLEEMNRKAEFDGSAILVKPTPGGDYRILRSQDGLFHLCLRGIRDGETIEEFQLISSISQVIHPYQEFDRFLDSARIPELNIIVSNTTEAGIVYRAEDRFSDIPALSFPGKLTQWLYHRYEKLEGTPESGCFILPFELIESNGDKLKEIVIQHAEDWDLEPGFVFWLNRHNSFCNTLVDRIVTGFPGQEAQAIQEKLGYDDKCLVVAEPYHLLAIEGGEKLEEFLPSSKAGLNVRFTDDLSPYRSLKVSILNGAHTSMVPVGILAGVATVGEFMADEKLGAWIEALLLEEVVPTLPSTTEEGNAYVATTLDRFRNPYMHHKLSDIALNSSAKVEARLLPTIIRYFQKEGVVPPRLTLALAAMIRFYKGRWKGQNLPVRDTDTALAHFKEAWEQKSLSQTANVALSFWPDIPDELRKALQKQLQEVLKKMDKGEIVSLLEN